MNATVRRVLVFLLAALLPLACYGQQNSSSSPEPTLSVSTSNRKEQPPPVTNNDNSSDRSRAMTNRSEYSGPARPGRSYPAPHGSEFHDFRPKSSESMPSLSALLNLYDVEIPGVIKDKLRNGLYWECWQTRMIACLRDSLQYTVAFNSYAKDYQTVVREGSAAEALASKQTYLALEAKRVDTWLENHQQLVVPLSNSWIKFKEDDTIGPGLKKVDSWAKVATDLAKIVPAVSESTRQLLQQAKDITGVAGEAYNWTVDGVGVGLAVSNIQAISKTSEGINVALEQDTNRFNLVQYRKKLAQDQKALGDEYARLRERATRLEIQECRALTRRYLEVTREYGPPTRIP